MKLIRILIQLPQHLKAKLDALRKEGTMASGYILALLERDLASRPENYPLLSRHV